MTSEEKKLLQAKHRLEEAQARDRVKERKARTRRLIQEGAVLEKVLPEVQAVGLDNLEERWSCPTSKAISCRSGNDFIFTLEGLRETGGFPFFVPEGRTYSPPAKAGGGSPPVGRARALSEGDCGSCGSRWTRLHFYQTASLAHAVGAGVSVLEAPVHGVVYCHPIPPPACVNLPPAA